MQQAQTEAIRKQSGDELLPWRCATALRSCSLYWLPVTLGTPPKSQKEWLLEFFRHLSENLQSQAKLRAETFMQLKVIQPPGELWETFSESMFETSPLAGLARRPGASDPPVLTKQDADDLAKGRKEYRPNEYMDDTCYWFMNKDDHRIRSLFLGNGGLTHIFLPAGEATTPPAPTLPPHVDPKSVVIPKFLREDPTMKLLLADFKLDDPMAMPAFLKNHPGMKQAVSTFRPEKISKSMESLSSDFGPRSKELFGFSMKRNLKFQSLPFIIPLLGTQDFFAQSEDTIKSWFGFFDVYINESSSDEGMVMASRDDLNPIIASIVSTMRQAGYRYWEG
ncbi:MAG TPA: hypothetical protein VKZ53_15830 [Candidatus Angelobacter sp.]|nr:hypothetical protein [Candidatus Angelobacter sp.]